ncbi:uncharacterized protein LOC114288365 [Camellia sinensis]|uniref:uncharacterized protein LOC114288365 n=1 Tax=Camellia sinensis TaxID=4442 RepID=UPI00103579A3|nr:uncharacterized protein LOC114288365 [Camellia sinensis]
MANNGNGSESSVSGTESMVERVMERAITSFLQALQTNINNGTPERREGPVTIKQFQDLKPTTFTGSPNPMVADAWVKDMEEIFRALPCTERQNVTFATFAFKDNTQEWWLLTLVKEEITTWARFLESKFTQLAQFATYVIPTATRKARKFETGLDAGIKDRLEVLKLPTYAEVVDRVYIVEKEIKASHSEEPSFKKRFWERDNRNSMLHLIKR